MRKDVDTIKLAAGQLEKIIEWRDQNKEAVRNFKDVFEEAVILSYNESAAIYFKVNGIYTEYEYYFKFKEEYILVLKAMTKRNGESFSVIKLGNTKDYSIDSKKLSYLKSIGIVASTDDLEALFVDNTTIHCSLMAYILYKSNEVEITEEDFMSPERLKKAEKHNKYNPSNKIKIKKRVIRLKNPTFKNVTKKEIKRVTESWGVRGHHRTRNGKQEWVRPYTKGKGARKTKDYSIAE